MTESPLLLTVFTLDPILNFIPFLVNIFWNSLEISLSIPGVIKSKYSITVTSEPNLDHTEPISRPIYPPPITASLPGTLSKDKAPVEETIFSSSISMPGNEETSDPVAITIFLALMLVLLLLLPKTTISFFEKITPLPFKYVTLFFLNKNSTPFVKTWIDLFLFDIIFFILSLIPAISIPCWLKSFFAL